MRIAFVGKGGSGKTTLAFLFASFLASQGKRVYAIDADINQHLALLLGAPEDLPQLGNDIGRIKEYVRGTNPRIKDTAHMVKTTPPGTGSQFIRLQTSDPIVAHFARLTHSGVPVMVTGTYTDDDVGVSCYHSKTGAVELLLNHLIDGPEEYVVVDMTAGADAFSSSLFTRFDLLVLVTEPTLQSVSVYDQYQAYGASHHLPLVVLGNKVEDDADRAFLYSRISKDTIVGFLGRSAYIRERERGGTQGILEAAYTDTLAALLGVLDAQEKNWDAYHAQTIEHHIKNAEGWANATTGVDLSEQIDPDFRLTTMYNS